MKIAYFHCFAGVSGDMILGALADAGLALKDLKAQLAALKVPGYSLSRRKVEKHHLGGTKVSVKLLKHDHGHRHLHHINDIIEKSRISDTSKANARSVFLRLAQCEAKVHRTTVDKIHFHEVGAVDAIVDIVGAVVGLELLGVQKVYASPVSVGTGTIRAAHGILPVPAPATVELLKGWPLVRTGIPAELTTPTGAALITTLAKTFIAPPPFTPTRVGYGAGGRDLEQLPNLLRLEIGDTLDGLDTDHGILIEANIDDMNPEVFGYVTEKLLAAGARDAYLTPVHMKKGRPGTLLSVLCAEPDLPKLAGLILAETTTIGVRYHRVGRFKAARRAVSFKSSLGTVRLKRVELNGAVRYSPEYDECVRVAKRKKKSLLDVYRLLEKESAGLH